MIEQIKAQIKSLDNTYKDVDKKRITLLYNKIKNKVSTGKKIIVSGLGKNVPIAEKFVGTMNSLGFKASFLHTNTALHGDLGKVDNEDIVILLTKSGNTSESIYLAKHLKKYSIDFLVLTFNKISKLSKLCNEQQYFSFKLENEGDLWNLVPNNSSISYLVLLQGISMKLMKDFELDKNVFRRNHPGGAIGEKL